MSNTSTTLISVAQAAQILAVHPATIGRMIARGETRRNGRVVASVTARTEVAA